MPRVCFFTGKKTKSGQNRSHSERKTKRRFRPNLLTKWVNMGNGMRIKIKVSAKAYKKMRGFL